MSFQVEPIGSVSSPFQQKFAIPRQPGLAPHAYGKLLINKPFGQLEAFSGVDSFSHIWVSFIFHQNQAKGWKPLVRPPRLGGNTKKGVFATRSSFRPNGIGLSVLELLAVKETARGVELEVGGLDLLDGTPIIDIKPYIPYADSIPHATAGFAQEQPEITMAIEFSETAAQFIEQQSSAFPHLRDLIVEVLQQDPRPAYKSNDVDHKLYAVYLYDFNVEWKVSLNKTLVTRITKR